MKQEALDNVQMGPAQNANPSVLFYSNVTK